MTRGAAPSAAPFAPMQTARLTLVPATTDADPASIAVLERSGFGRDGEGAEPGSMRFVHATI